MRTETLDAWQEAGFATVVGRADRRRQAFGNATVTGIEVVVDEGTDVGPGFVYLDNIDVNGALIGKPGNAK